MVNPMTGFSASMPGMSAMSPMAMSTPGMTSMASAGATNACQCCNSAQPGQGQQGTPMGAAGGDFMAMMGMMMGMLMSMMMLMMTTMMSQMNAGGGAARGAAPGGSPGSGGTASGTPSSSSGGSTPGGSTSGSGAASKSGVITTNAGANTPAGKGNGKPNVLIEGDSLSTSTGGGFTYSDQLAKRVGGAKFTQLAKGGDTLSGGISKDAAANANKFDPNAKDNVVVLWGGTNDLHGGKSGRDTYAQLEKTAKAYKDKGFKVVVLTSIQLGGSQDNAGKDQQRREFNDLIRRNNGPWDSVVDVASLPQFSDKDNGVTGNKSIYAGDGVHLTQQGYGLISEQVERALKAMGIG